MSDSDAPTDRDDADGDVDVSRQFDDDGSESEAAVRQHTGSGEGDSTAGTDRSNGRVVPRVAGETDESETDPTDAAVIPEPEPIEPETPRAENAVFVLLGVFGTIALLATVIVPGVV